MAHDFVDSVPHLSFNPDGRINERPRPGHLDHLTALSDPTRSRMLLLIDRHELTVSSSAASCRSAIHRQPSSEGAGGQSGWIAARNEGTSHLYTMTRDELDAPARRLWLLVREHGPTPAATQDQRRLHVALAERRTRRRSSFHRRRAVGSRAGRAVRRSRAPRRVGGARGR